MRTGRRWIGIGLTFSFLVVAMLCLFSELGLARFNRAIPADCDKLIRYHVVTERCLTAVTLTQPANE